MGASCRKRAAPDAPERAASPSPRPSEPAAATITERVTEAPTALPFWEELKGHLFIFVMVSCACFLVISVSAWFVAGLLGLFSLILWFGVILTEKDKDRKRGPGVIVKYIVLALTWVVMLLVLIAAFKAWGILEIRDPTTSVRGIGIEDLGEHVKRDKPNAHDVVLKNGFVRVDWAGEYHDTHCHHDQPTLECSEVQYTAAPIYRDMASASGPPLAWAVRFEQGPVSPLHPSYCTGAGLCGFYAGVLERGESREYEKWYVRAADQAAEKGGFTYRDGLPKLEMMNVFKSWERLEWWYLHFWTWFGLLVALMLVSDVCIFLTKENVDETLPLV